MDSQSHSRPACAPRRVLIVDDSADCRESLRLLLTLMGYHVETAADGAAGVRQGLASPPDVAVVDVGLPGLDGFAVGRRLREALGPGLILVALTGYGDPETTRELAAAGFDDHLVKPVDLHTLQSLIRSARSSVG